METTRSGLALADARSPEDTLAARSRSARRGEDGRRTSAFVLLRFTLLIATSYMLLAGEGFAGLPPFLSVWIGIGLVSNVVATRLPRRIVEAPAFGAGALVFDTLWITVALVVTGSFEPEFFYLYFFVLFLAAVGESLGLIALGTVVVSGAYLYALTTSGTASLAESSTLIRLPFLFAVASFYGYLVQRVRRERHRAGVEAEAVRRLEEVRRNLETANRRLEREARERRQAEESLREANRELAKLSELKSAFVSTVSHELRTPLTSIQNALDLLRSGKPGPLAPDQRRFLDMARRNQDRLATIIDDLLDLSKIEAGRLEYRFEEVEGGRLLAEVGEAIEPQAVARKVEIAVAPPASLPPVLADPERLTQVLTNLVGNALKFTPKGGRVTLSGRTAGPWVELSVADTGPGVPAADRARIFEPFHQASEPGQDPLTRTVRGTGLGLAISRDLVWAHGGELAVADAPGGGSVFTVRLPADLARARETVAFEEEFRRHRKYPFFGLLVLDWPEGAAGAFPEDREALLSVLLAVRDGLREALPRDCDLIRVQPAHRRILLVLLATPRNGSEVVRRRLGGRLAETAIRVDGAAVPPLRILGPAAYPDDGPTGRALITKCLAGASSGAEDAAPAATSQTIGGPSDDPAEDSGGGRRAGRGGDAAVPADTGRLRGNHGHRRPGGLGRRPVGPAGPGADGRDDAEGERVPRVAHAAGG